MSKEPNKVQVGQLFIAHTSFLCNKTGSNRREKVEILKNEILEIRYPFAWHFRIIFKNIYAQCSETELLRNCNLYGVIHRKVCFENKVGLKAILDKKLYDSVNDILFGHKEVN